MNYHNTTHIHALPAASEHVHLVFVISGESQNAQLHFYVTFPRSTLPSEPRSNPPVRFIPSARHLFVPEYQMSHSGALAVTPRRAASQRRIWRATVTGQVAINKLSAVRVVRCGRRRFPMSPSAACPLRGAGQGSPFPARRSSLTAQCARDAPKCVRLG